VLAAHGKDSTVGVDPLAVDQKGHICKVGIIDEASEGAREGGREGRREG